MKKAACAAAISLAALTSTANAGGYVTPVTPEVVIVEDTAASSQGIFVPIFAVLLLILLHHN